MPERAFGGYVYRIPRDVLHSLSQHPLLMSFMITHMGYFVDATHHFAERETIDEYIIMYCHAGTGWLRMNGDLWRVNAGDLAVVMKDSPHSYGAYRDDPWTIYWAHFNGTQAATYLELVNISSDNPVLTLPEQNRLKHLFMEITTILQTGYSFHHLASASDMLRQVLSHIAFQKSLVHTESNTTFNVSSSIDTMRNHLSGQCTLDMLAEQAALSPSYFSRLFRQATGYPPVEYFIRLKMQKACELLEITSMSVQEISDFLGYSNPYYFSRLFKKIIGTPPSVYRRDAL